MLPVRWILLVFVTCSAGMALAAPMVLNSQPRHLRSGTNAEWDEFASQIPDGKRLDVRFTAAQNRTAQTLFIQQDEVRQDWNVELNGKRIGKLFTMEADLIHTLAIPPNGLRGGTNLLSIIPPARENDDIIIRQISLVDAPAAQALGECTLEASIRDVSTGEAIPARITITTPDGALAPLLALSNAPPAAVRPGVAYVGNGQLKIGLPAGDYTVYASRGFEWSVATQHLHLVRAEVARADFTLRREVDTRGWISCDTHVHTLTHSRHGDATVDERALTLAGEGIELPIATEHNLHVDYDDATTRMGVGKWYTPVPGNEVTTTVGHFNIFPVAAGARVPDFHMTDWPRLMTEMRATPGVRVVVLNHPLNIHNNFQPFAATNFDNVTGENKRGPEFTFDCIEVMNSSAQQSDNMAVFRGWFALLNHGYHITALGSSDCHDVSRYIVGQGRTYIAGRDDDPSHVDIAAACSNLLGCHALVSMGLLADLVVEGRYHVGDVATDLGPEIHITARVQGPGWVTATNVALYANGEKVREATLTGGRDQKVNWVLPRPERKTHLVAIATGPGITAPFWAIPKPYQPSSPAWKGRVYGITNPIWLETRDY